MRLGLVLVTVLFGCAEVQDARSAEGGGVAGGAGVGGVGGAFASGGAPAVAGASGEAGMDAMPHFEAGAGGPAADPCAAPPVAGMAQPGCACEPGTMPSSCDPPDIRVVQNGLSGSLVCSEGVAYCRRGTWSACEVLIQYAKFVPD